MTVISSAKMASKNSGGSTAAMAPPPGLGHPTNNNNNGSSVIESTLAELNMGGGEYFGVGAVVRVTMVNANAKDACAKPNVVEGEVMGFDPQSRMLVLKTTATSKRSALNDVWGLNLNMASDVKVVVEAPTGDKQPQLSNLNNAKLETRVNTAIERKKRLIKAFKSGISPEGQKLFQTISKTIDEIDWNDDKIVVMGKVTIYPPYFVDNVKGDAKAVLHVKKIVEKHTEDMKRLSDSPSSTTNPSSAQPQPHQQPSSSTQSSKASSPSTSSHSSSYKSSGSVGRGGGGSSGSSSSSRPQNPPSSQQQQRPQHYQSSSRK